MKHSNATTLNHIQKLQDHPPKFLTKNQEKVLKDFLKINSKRFNKGNPTLGGLCPCHDDPSKLCPCEGGYIFDFEKLVFRNSQGVNINRSLKSPKIEKFNGHEIYIYLLHPGTLWSKGKIIKTPRTKYGELHISKPSVGSKVVMLLRDPKSIKKN